MNIQQSTIEKLIAKLDGTAGVVIRDLDLSAGFTINADTQFRAASLIKLPILYSFFKQATAGAFDPDELTTVARTDVTRGFGVLRTLQPGLHLRWRDLATLMVIVSDNTATNMLIDWLGMSTINADLRQLGMTNTILQRKMGDYDNPADNLTTPVDVEKVLIALQESSKLADEYRYEIATILHGQQCRNKLRWHIPEAVALAHKTGDLPGVEHDAGILTVGDRRTLIVVMTHKLASNTQGEALSRSIGKIVYEDLSG